MIIEDKQGNQLLELQRGAEETLAVVETLTHAVVVVRNGDERHLLVYDRYKQHWELAGGAIEPPETARECACRELQEESGILCAADSLRFVGVMKFLLAPSPNHSSSRIEYGALYATDVTQPPPFEANAEIAAVTWWDRIARIGDVAEIDAKLIELAGKCNDGSTANAG